MSVADDQPPAADLPHSTRNHGLRNVAQRAATHSPTLGHGVLSPASSLEEITMARFYYMGESDRIAYSLERCEEVVLLDAYLQVARRIPPDQSYFRSQFEKHYFEIGNGVAQSFVDQLNSHLRRCRIPEVIIRETEISDYGRNPDRSMKADRRQQLRTALETMPKKQRTAIVAHALTEMDELPAPHRTVAEYEVERKRRQQVAPTRVIMVPQPPQRPALKAEEMLRLLGATDDEELRNQVISRMPTSDLVAHVTDVPDQTLRNRLIAEVLRRAA